MRVKTLLSKGALVAVACVVSCASIAANLYAEEGPRNIVWAQSGGITVIGEIEPGEKYSNTIQLWNDSDKPAISEMSVSPYGVDKSGNYGVVDEHEVRSSMYSWLTYANESNKTQYILQPNETIQVPYTISVPSDWTISGSQSTAITVSSREYDKEKEQHEGINVKTEYAHLIHANIKGSEDLVFNGQIANWDTPYVLFDNTNGLQVSTTIKNTGNATFPVSVKTEMYDKFSQQLVFSDDNEPYVLADSSKEIIHTWKEAPAIGLFDVKGEVLLDGDAKHFSRTVLIIPLWFVVIVVAIIILLVWALILRVKQVRAKNKRLKS